MANKLKCIGAIAGDIVGSTREFEDFDEYDFDLFDDGEAFFTDDTVLTVAVMDKLTEDFSMLNKRHCGNSKNSQKLPTYEEAFVKWTDNYPDCSWGTNFLRWLASAEKHPYNSCGNGSAMRVSPVAWVYNTLKDVRNEARKSSEVTHNHPEGIKAAEAVASAVFLARTKHSKSEIQHYIEDNFGYNLDRSVAELALSYRYSELAQYSVPESIIAFLDSNDFEDAIRLAVSLNGDADTMAAITGSIAEAYYGIPDAIYQKTLELLPKDITEVIRKFQKIIE